MTRSSKITDEIDRLMRDPNALQPERSPMPHSDGRDHYDPRQPRVPAGDPRGGRWTAGGYRGGDSNHDAGNAQTPYDDTRLAQLGAGNPAGPPAQPAPFNGLFGDINAAQHLTSQNGFIQTERAHPRSERTQDLFVTADRRYRFVTPIPATPEQIPGGTRWIISATTYAYDRTTGAYATIPATPARPMIVTDSNGRLSVRPFNRQ